MKKFFLQAFFFTAIAVFPVRLMGQVSSTVTDINVDANIIAPISVENTGSTHINFGTITRSTTAGTVTVSPTNDISCTDGATVLGTTHSAATFKATGEPSAQYSIGFSDCTLYTNDEAYSMIVDGFTTNANKQLDANGIEEFAIGATLHVKASQATGTYTGTLDVTISYQ